ncbi:MAG: hypothetical protein PHV33_01450 [Elusimicrobiales bacterium]|nr:hypothetical protein [Elusimicrobiales bacterium]
MKKVSLRILQWGAYLWAGFSLLFLLYGFVSLKLQDLRSAKSAQAEDSKPYEKVYGEFTARITHEGQEYLDGHYLSVFRSGKLVVDRFKLPVKESGVYEFSPTDIRVIPGKAGGLKVVLLSAVHDCDAESMNYVWFFRFSDKGELVRRLSLSGLRVLNAAPLRLAGSSIVWLPGTGSEDNNAQSFVVQTELSVGDKAVRLAPMLRKDALASLSRAFKTELGLALSEAKGSGKDTGPLLQAEKDFNQAVSGMVFDY